MTPILPLDQDLVPVSAQRGSGSSKGPLSAPWNVLRVWGNVLSVPESQQQPLLICKHKIIFCFLSVPRTPFMASFDMSTKITSSPMIRSVPFPRTDSQLLFVCCYPSVQSPCWSQEGQRIQQSAFGAGYASAMKKAVYGVVFVSCCCPVSSCVTSTVKFRFNSG